MKKFNKTQNEAVLEVRKTVFMTYKEQIHSVKSPLIYATYFKCK